MIQEKVLEYFSGRNVLVTGGTGLIGRQVVDMLCSAGAHVKIVSLDRIKVHDNAEHVVGDLTNFDFCKEITKDMDFVFHLAGIKGSMEVSKTKLASHFVPTLMFNAKLFSTISALSASITARSMQCCSSLTLPGQVYFRSFCFAF